MSMHFVFITEAPNDNYKGRDNDAQSLRDSILRSPSDDSLSQHSRPDQGSFCLFTF